MWESGSVCERECVRESWSVCRRVGVMMMASERVCYVS